MWVEYKTSWLQREKETALGEGMGLQCMEVPLSDKLMATHNSFSTPEPGDTNQIIRQKAHRTQREILVCTLCNLTIEPSAQDAVEAKTINRFEKAVRDIMEEKSISGC